MGPGGGRRIPAPLAQGQTAAESAGPQAAAPLPLPSVLLWLRAGKAGGGGEGQAPASEAQ